METVGATLPRIPSSQQKLREVGSSNDILAEKTRALLGYEPMANASQRQQDNLQLATLLQEIVLEPFEPSAVDNFKKKKCRRANLATSFLCGLSIASFVAFYGSIFTIFVQTEVFSTKPTNDSLYFVFWISLVVFLFLAASSPIWEKKVEWREFPIKKCGNEVPTVVLETAVKVKNRCQEIGVFIECIKEKEVECGSFLIIRLGKSDPVYLEWWNEPDFKAMHVC